MTDVNFTFRTDEALKSAFVEAARGNNRNASIVLRDFMQKYVSKAAGRPEDRPPPKHRALPRKPRRTA